MKTKVGLFLTIVALLCLLGWTSRAQKEPQTRITWEYTSTNNAGDLNKLGAQGWELVGISDFVTTNGGYISSTSYFYLKRAK